MTSGPTVSLKCKPKAIRGFRVSYKMPTNNRKTLSQFILVTSWQAYSIVLVHTPQYSFTTRVIKYTLQSKSLKLNSYHTNNIFNYANNVNNVKTKIMSIEAIHYLYPVVFERTLNLKYALSTHYAGTFQKLYLIIGLVKLLMIVITLLTQYCLCQHQFHQNFCKYIVNTLPTRNC